jgi:hypothetical protein
MFACMHTFSECCGAPRSRTFWPELILELSAPGQNKVVNIIIIYLEQEQAGDLNRYSFKKIMITPHLTEKVCKQVPVPTKLKSEPKQIVSTPQY